MKGANFTFSLQTRLFTEFAMGGGENIPTISRCAGEMESGISPGVN